MQQNKKSYFSVMIATVLLTVGIIGWDVYAACFRTVDDSVSHIITNGAKKKPLIAFLFGFIMGHLFWSQQQGKDKTNV